ncbi:LURP1-related protein domain containing protein [Parasponia andersonii]|uniref:LURP1-related protein domain containing protein n=1 Tax=Parasponia andersonii TaxID=3476 RepID=A0A2P5E0J4_PARAD|nr:LURP1-related protein domain containing protein [Parasponia andersonii]
MEKAPGLPPTCDVPMVSVVGDGFCVPYPVELTVKKKNHGLFDSCYEALDVNGNLFLQVNGSFRNFQKKRVMRDAAGLPLLTMREKTCIEILNEPVLLTKRQGADITSPMDGSSRGKLGSKRHDFQRLKIEFSPINEIPTRFSWRAISMKIFPTFRSLNPTYVSLIEFTEAQLSLLR